MRARLGMLALLLLGCTSDTTPCDGTLSHYGYLDLLDIDELRVVFVVDGGASLATREGDVAPMTELVTALLDGDTDGDGVTDVDPSEDLELRFARADAGCGAAALTIDLGACGGYRDRWTLREPNANAIRDFVRCALAAVPPSCGPARQLDTLRALMVSYIEADAVVVVSHRDDESGEDPTQLATELAAGNTIEQWTLGQLAVIGGLPVDAAGSLDDVLADPRMHALGAVCGVADAAATPSARLVELARSLHGTARSICGGRWAAALASVIAEPHFSYDLRVGLIEAGASGAVRCDVDLEIPRAGSGVRYDRCDLLPIDAERVDDGYDPDHQLCRLRQATDPSDLRGWHFDPTDGVISLPGLMHRHFIWPSVSCIDVQSPWPVCAERWLF